jgi:hypothetical protein
MGHRSLTCHHPQIIDLAPIETALSILSKAEQLELRNKLGAIYYWDAFNFGGHYHVDLENITDVKMMALLFEKTEREKQMRKSRRQVYDRYMTGEHPTPELSQKGDESMLRNIMLDGTERAGLSLNALPKTGVLTFDVTSTFLNDEFRSRDQRHGPIRTPHGEVLQAMDPEQRRAEAQRGAEMKNAPKVINSSKVLVTVTEDQRNSIVREAVAVMDETARSSTENATLVLTPRVRAVCRGLFLTSDDGQAIYKSFRSCTTKASDVQKDALANELISVLYGRTVDPEGYCKLLQTLGSVARAALFRRIGPKFLFDPGLEIV